MTKKAKSNVAVWGGFCDEPPVLFFQNAQAACRCPYCGAENAVTLEDNHRGEMDIVRYSFDYFDDFEYKKDPEHNFTANCASCSREFGVDVTVKYVAEISYKEVEIAK